MLYWHFRNIQCLLVGFFKKKLLPTDIVTKSFFANPFDTDWFQVMRAGQYFLYSDASRWDLGVRTGFLKAAIKNKWVIVMGGQKIIHWRPIRIFRTFQVSVQFVAWDDKWIYVAHTFSQSGAAKAVLFSKVGLRQKGKLCDPRIAFQAMGHQSDSPSATWILNHFANDLETFEDTSTKLNQNTSLD